MWGGDFVSFFCMQLSSFPNIIFFQCIYLDLLSWIDCPKIFRFRFGLSNLVHWSVYLLLFILTAFCFNYYNFCILIWYDFSYQFFSQGCFAYLESFMVPYEEGFWLLHILNILKEKRGQRGRWEMPEKEMKTKDVF